MLTIRAMAAIAAVIVAAIAGTPAVACDSNYAWNCKPVPPIEPPDTAAESEKAAKPLQVTRRRAGSKAARAERSEQTQRKRFGRKSGSKSVLSVRARRAKAIAARAREQTTIEEIPIGENVRLPPSRSKSAPPRVSTPADPSASSGEAPDLNQPADVLQPQSVVTVPVSNPAGEARAAPAPQPAVRAVSQNEVNELDLAAAPEPDDQSWMRTLVLAFGGVLAVGSALRLFL
jgi:hypothetical protein